MTQWPKALCGACVLEFSEVPEVCTQRRTLDLKPKAKELEGKDAVGLVNTQDFLKPCRKQRLWNNSSSYFNLKKKTSSSEISFVYCSVFYYKRKN